MQFIIKSKKKMTSSIIDLDSVARANMMMPTVYQEVNDFSEVTDYGRIYCTKNPNVLKLIEFNRGEEGSIDVDRVKSIGKLKETGLYMKMTETIYVNRAGLITNGHHRYADAMKNGEYVKFMIDLEARLQTEDVNLMLSHLSNLNGGPKSNWSGSENFKTALKYGAPLAVLINRYKTTNADYLQAYHIFHLLDRFNRIKGNNSALPKYFYDDIDLYNLAITPEHEQLTNKYIELGSLIQKIGKPTRVIRRIEAIHNYIVENNKDANKVLDLCIKYANGFFAYYSQVPNHQLFDDNKASFKKFAERLVLVSEYSEKCSIQNAK